jgi:hypothetical protein
MDTNRLLLLAGVKPNLKEELESNIKELTEDMSGLPSISVEGVPMEELEARLDAAKRGLSIAHRLRNPLEKKMHFSRILSNLNRIRGTLQNAIKNM